MSKWVVTSWEELNRNNFEDCDKHTKPVVNRMELSNTGGGQTTSVTNSDPTLGSSFKARQDYPKLKDKFGN